MNKIQGYLLAGIALLVAGAAFVLRIISLATAAEKAKNLEARVRGQSEQKAAENASQNTLNGEIDDIKKSTIKRGHFTK